MRRAAPANPSASVQAASDAIASLSLFRFDRWADRFWAFGQMGAARRPLRNLPHAGFVKLMGSGVGEGFTPLPDSVVAVLVTWHDLQTAESTTTEAPVFRRYLARASEAFTVYLAPIASRGRWSGHAPFALVDDPSAAAGPVAALTRATIRPRALVRFWRRAPAISARIGRDPNVLFKIGVGEVPLLHQVTFSIWPDTASMDAFARSDGPHAAAIRSVRSEGWFAEELYARFAVRARRGTWGGVDPLAAAPLPVAAE